MGHPGFGYTRRSYHTLSPFACPRRGYLSQMLEVRFGPGPVGWKGPLNVGKLFHSLVEFHYRRLVARAKGKPRKAFKLFGTDGQPICASSKEVVAHYERQGYSQEALAHGEQLYRRYALTWRNETTDPFVRQCIGIEKDVKGDLRALLPKSMAVNAPPLPYSAAYDLIVTAGEQKKVASVEHKGLATFTGGTLFLYLNSGQVIGQCAVWNSRADLVERWGPMDTVWMNIAFKDGKSKADRPTHRESLYIPRAWQREYAIAYLHRATNLETSLEVSEHATTPDEVQNAWPKLGMFNGDCVEMTRTCEYQQICYNGDVVSDTYQITEAGAVRARRDGVVRVDPLVETYSLE